MPITSKKTRSPDGTNSTRRSRKSAPNRPARTRKGGARSSPKKSISAGIGTKYPIKVAKKKKIKKRPKSRYPGINAATKRPVRL